MNPGLFLGRKPTWLQPVPPRYPRKFKVHPASVPICGQAHDKLPNSGQSRGPPDLARKQTHITNRLLRYSDIARPSPTKTYESIDIPP